MNFDDFKFRCHYQGDLISVPKPLTITNLNKLEDLRKRANGEGRKLTEKQVVQWHDLEFKQSNSNVFKLSTTAKKLCSKIYFNYKHGRRSQIKSKFLEKGSEVEKESRDTLSSLLNIRLTSDNERKSNDWVIGQRDIKSNIIIDLKSTWDFDTYTNHIIDPNDDFYFRQLDSYMDLWKVKDSMLAYVLTNTPIHLVEKELMIQNYTHFFLDDMGDVKNEKIQTVVNIVNQHIYTRRHLENFCDLSSTVHIDWFKDFKEIELKDRVHLVPHSFDPIRIEQRNECLSLCREYMNNIKPINNVVPNI